MIDEKDGKITSTGGRIIRLPQINITPALSKEKAFEKAKEYIGAEKYIWDEDKTKIPEGELVIEPINRDFDGNKFVLCWHFRITSLKPFNSLDINIDAHTGKEINRVSNIQFSDKAGTAKLLYTNNEEKITTDYYLNGKSYLYRLQESNRRIKTFNAQGVRLQTFNKTNAIDFANEDNTWNDEFFPSHIKRAACQLHWGFEKVYDYFLKKGLNSYDGKGAQIESYLDVDFKDWDWLDGKNLNASWVGIDKNNNLRYNFFLFGNGGWFNDYVVGLDVVGHEFTHAVIENHSGLLYENETGALNESFADILGTVIEFNTYSNGNWTIGEDCGEVLRSMSNPKLYSQPRTYKDTKNYWKGIVSSPNKDNDFGWVHTNGGVQNYWFYLLCNGGTSQNDLGNQYAVTGIGMDKASAIVLQIILNHCNKIFDYNSARQASLIATTEKNGSNSTEYNAVNAAWYAVGVGVQPPAIVQASDGLYSDKVRISWETKTGMYYQVFRNTIDNNSTATPISGWISAGINFDDLSAQQGVVYYYWVKASENSAGNYASIFSVSDSGNKMPYACYPASSLSSINITASGARVNYTLPASLSSASLEYRNTNTSTWSAIGIATSSSYADLTGLVASTSYKYRVKTVCTNGASNYTAEYSFTTIANATCSPASNIAGSNLSSSGVRISYSLPSGLSSASLEYRKASITSWTSKSITTNSNYVDLTGLSPSTTYYFRIKTVCTNGSVNYTNEFYCTTTSFKNAMIGSINSDPAIYEGFNVMCYPNPASITLYVKILGGSDQIFEVKLTSIVGQIVFHNNFSGNELQEIDVQKLTKGLYILLINANNETKSVKIIIN